MRQHQDGEEEGGGVACGGEVFVCARASMSVSAHGGGRNLKRREGSVQGET